MEKLYRLFRLGRTLRHVPAQALLWRLRARLFRIYYRMPLYGAGRLAGGGGAQPPQWVGVELVAGDAVRGRMLAAGTFRFVGEEHRLGKAPFDWFPAKASALWAFNLHYHEWLADMKAGGQREAAQALVGDWMVQFGSYHEVAWHPYPTSLRLVAWLTHGKWLLEGAGEDFREAFYELLYRQADYLMDNCEWDLGGNHLLKNVKALVYAGVALEGRRQMYERGMGEFLRQLKHQILPDGGHYERSPLYQAQVLRDVADVRALLRKATGADNAFLDGVCAQAGAALAVMALPRVGLGLFNDSARLDSGYVDTLLRLSGADDAPEILPHTGYARLERGKTCILMDGGKVGPDENPGHAHADVLSFELVKDGVPVIVNGGTYAYQHRLRNIFRGTPAHSTVDVAGEDSAEVWGVFRVGRRPAEVAIGLKGVEDGEVAAEGYHDGYRHLGVWHARKVVLAGDGSRLRGEDTLALRPGRRFFRRGGRQRVMAHFILHPDVGVRLLSDSEAELTLPAAKTAKFSVSGGRLDVRDAVHAPQFGELLQTKKLVIHASVGDRDCRLDWQLMFN